MINGQLIQKTLPSVDMHLIQHHLTKQTFIHKQEAESKLLLTCTWYNKITLKNVLHQSITVVTSLGAPLPPKHCTWIQWWQYIVVICDWSLSVHKIIMSIDRGRSIRHGGASSSSQISGHAWSCRAWKTNTALSGGFYRKSSLKNSKILTSIKWHSMDSFVL